MTTPDELERAVSNLKGLARLLEKYDPWSGIRPKSDAADLRLLLSERAELLATVERMRGGLEKIAAYYPPGHRVEELARAALTTGEATNAGENGNGRLMP